VSGHRGHQWIVAYGHKDRSITKHVIKKKKRIKSQIQHTNTTPITLQIPKIYPLQLISCAPHYTSNCYNSTQQELSYRKQIARQLRTQYVEGIYRPKYYTVTLKSRLRVTQGHWKRNRWTDHT